MTEVLENEADESGKVLGFRKSLLDINFQSSQNSKKSCQPNWDYITKTGGGDIDFINDLPNGKPKQIMDYNSLP